MNIIEQFENVYFSNKNSEYIKNYVHNKVKRNLNIDINQNQNSNLLNSILVSVFETFKDKISKDYSESNENFDYESILINLNKMAMIKYESTLEQLLINQPIENKSVVNKVTSPSVRETQTQTQIQSLIQKQTQTQSKIKNIDEKDQRSFGIQTEQSQSDIKENNNNNNNSKYNEVSRINYHFFSEDTSDEQIQEGIFKFNLDINNINSLKIKLFRLKKDTYNIESNNNVFYIIKDNEKHPIHIPIGYYSISTLVKEISKNLLTGFHINYDVIKNRIIIKNTSEEDYKIFRLVFPSSDILSIGEILGFQEKEYKNSSTYIGEGNPIIEDFNNIYLRLFINDTEIKNVYSTKNDFSYFHYYKMKENTRFIQSDEVQEFTFTSNTNIKSIGFQLLCNPYMILSNINFETLILFE